MRRLAIILVPVAALVAVGWYFWPRGDDEDLRASSVFVELRDTSAGRDASGQGFFRIRLQNIHETERVKYYTFYVTPFNAVGDPSGSPIAVRGIGPIEPGEVATYEFDGAWAKNSTLACAELTRLDVEWMDGHQDTYRDELRLAEQGRENRVDLSGDCR